jgi:glycosyltransferase involved in cell wall biosynthesis
MKISIVIPVYNEAESLGACLRAISALQLKPYEVIVVDNNSTDNTAAIARSFDFVRLIREPRQGVIHARTTGFNAARGDIIARIDADSLLPSDWLTKVKRIMADEGLAAVSGAPNYHDFALPRVANRLDHWFRQRLADKLGDNNFLYGANMALRRSAWLAVRPLLCVTGQQHEDFDLAIHLQAIGLKVAYDSRLVAGVSSRRINSDFGAYVRYTLASPRTYAMHSLNSRRHMYPVLLACWIGYLPGHFLNKAYDPLTKEFSWSQLLVANSQRVDPTVNVA